MSRGLITSDGYKFIHYFRPGDFNLNNNPDELHNLAEDRNANAALLLSLNTLMNSLISREIGSDAGREVSSVLEALRSGQ